MKPHRAKSAEANRAGFRRQVGDAKAMLATAAEHLRKVLDDEPIEAETPAEVSAAMNLALNAVEQAMRVLRRGGPRSSK